jgi:hypothetical protein
MIQRARSAQLLDYGSYGRFFPALIRVIIGFTRASFFGRRSRGRAKRKSCDVTARSPHSQP